jgi:hypothetical protein
VIWLLDRTTCPAAPPRGGPNPSHPTGHGRGRRVPDRPCASEILAEALTAALQPANRKVQRSWNPKEVSELLELSRKALERAIEHGKIPSGTVARRRRMFTLGKIHTIKGKFGVRLWRDPKTGPPAVIAVVNFKGGCPRSRPQCTWARTCRSRATGR